jgi:hypothetical protein
MCAVKITKENINTTSATMITKKENVDAMSAKNTKKESIDTTNAGTMKGKEGEGMVESGVKNARIITEEAEAMGVKKVATIARAVGITDQVVHPMTRSMAKEDPQEGTTTINLSAMTTIPPGAVGPRANIPAEAAITGAAAEGKNATITPQAHPMLEEALTAVAPTTPLLQCKLRLSTLDTAEKTISSPMPLTI